MLNEEISETFLSCVFSPVIEKRFFPRIINVRFPLSDSLFSPLFLQSGSTLFLSQKRTRFSEIATKDNKIKYTKIKKEKNIVVDKATQ